MPSFVECFRTACHKPAHPAAWNFRTNGLYCLSCMMLIEEASDEVLFPYAEGKTNHIVRAGEGLVMLKADQVKSSSEITCDGCSLENECDMEGHEHPTCFVQDE